MGFFDGIREIREVRRSDKEEDRLYKEISNKARKESKILVLLSKFSKSFDTYMEYVLVDLGMESVEFKATKPEILACMEALLEDEEFLSQYKVERDVEYAPEVFKVSIRALDDLDDVQVDNALTDMGV